MESTINVQGMTCNHCKAAVEGAVSKVDGVQSAVVSLEDNNVTVKHNEQVSIDTIKEAIEDQGYDVK